MLTILDLVGVGIHYVHIDYLKIDLRRKIILNNLYVRNLFPPLPDLEMSAFKTVTPLTYMYKNILVKTVLTTKRVSKESTISPK